MTINNRVIAIAVGVATSTGLLVAAGGGGDREFRTIDGSRNNPLHPDWGSVGEELLRLTKVSYADGAAEPAGGSRPGPRAISNAVCAQPGDRPNDAGHSDFVWQWGQFIDHDITLVDPAEPLEPFDIAVPLGDRFFDPSGHGDHVIELDRSAYNPLTGGDVTKPRQQIESITAFIDGSQVYGCDTPRATALRTNEGTGRLKTSKGNLLPFNTEGFPNLGGPDPTLFLAGDIRANEQIALTAMHTLFMREHNRIADRIREDEPQLSGEQIYQRARAIVGAEIQVITYREFLPILLGPDAIDPYEGYRADVNPGIANVFATAAYRVGHTLLSPVLRRLDKRGETLEWGDVPLRDAFLIPERIIDEGGIAPILRGLASQRAQTVDAFVIDDVRNFLFGRPGDGGFDLPALNIQRGRDHGLASYNETRIEFGLSPAERFSDITSDPDVRRRLADVYHRVDRVDVWPGAIAEDHAPGAGVGPLIQRIAADQFARLRDGDRFWYQNVFDGRELAELEATRLSDVIRRNTEISGEIQDNVFHVVVCDADVDGDGTVGLTDLLAVLVAWGNRGGSEDIDGSGDVGFIDLIMVTAAWGECP